MTETTNTLVNEERYEDLNSVLLYALHEKNGRIVPSDNSDTYIHFTGDRYEMVENGEAIPHEMSWKNVKTRVTGMGWELQLEEELDLMVWLEEEREK